MGAYKITHSKKDGADEDRRIDGLKGPECGYHNIDQFIRWIKDGHTFYVVVDSHRVEIEIRRHATSRREYLTTQGDGFPPNNLLDLPDCD